MTDKPEKEFIILRETVFQSWLRDAGTFALICGLIIPGILVESSAMQWAGFVIAAICIGSKASKASKAMTREEAILHLREMPPAPPQEGEG